jgi:C4-dicarboxylate-specific signal transduction histidine kinase
MGQVAASIAHEVSQPIMAMLLNAEAALSWLDQQPPDVAAVRRTLESILTDANRAGEVINWIRALIKKSPAPKESIDINTAIEDVLTITRSELLKHGVTVQTNLAAGLPRVEGYRVQLQQVVLNLILNAIEAMSRLEQGPRELAVSTSMDAPNVIVVAVRDSGPGLDPAMANQLFQPFITTKPEGIGMGLAICDSIIRGHGGRLSAGANSPRGAVLQFTLRTQPK